MNIDDKYYGVGVIDAGNASFQRSVMTAHGRFFIPNDNQPSAGIRDLVAYYYTAEDQFVYIIPGPADASPKDGQWRREFDGTYAVPALIVEEDGLKDVSWHNDFCPSFAWKEDEDTLLRLWVDHPVDQLREVQGNKRFAVQWSDEAKRDPKAETFETDNAAEALARMREWRKELGIRATPGPVLPDAVALCKAFVADLKSALSESEWREMCERNRTETNPSVCHSHDFVDANENMARAWKACGGDEEALFGDTETADRARARWNEAWAMAMPLLGRVP